MHADVIGSQSERGGLVQTLAGTRAKRNDPSQLIDVAVKLIPPHLLRHVPHLSRGPENDHDCQTIQLTMT